MQTQKRVKLHAGRQIGPANCPAQYEEVAYAFIWGWQCGHGLACHNVPQIGKTYWTAWEGKSLCTTENAKDLHECLCFEAESNARQFSPWETLARDMNADANPDLAWEAYEEGVRESIWADIASYTEEDYK